MRKLIFQMVVSVDGYFEGPNREIDWHVVDAEFNEQAIELLESVDTLLFGRVTYQLMADYWPSPDAVKNDPIITEKMNSLHKIVVSRTLKNADWNNTTLIHDNVPEEILKLKQQDGKDIVVFGSSKLALALMRHGLIDEYRFMVNPILLGKGNSVLQGAKGRLSLRLLKARTFKSGNVLLIYQPAGRRGTAAKAIA